MSLACYNNIKKKKRQWPSRRIVHSKKYTSQYKNGVILNKMCVICEGDISFFNFTIWAKVDMEPGCYVYLPMCLRPNHCACAEQDRADNFEGG